MKTQRGNPVLFRSLQIEILSEMELHELNDFLQKFEHKNDKDVISRLAATVKAAIDDPNSHVQVDMNTINNLQEINKVNNIPIANYRKNGNIGPDL